MAKPSFPSDQQDKFMLRLPDGMRDRIKAVAETNGRSMNAEIVGTLEKAYPVPVPATSTDEIIDQVRSDGVERIIEREGYKLSVTRTSGGKIVLEVFDDQPIRDAN